MVSAFIQHNRFVIVCLLWSENYETLLSAACMRMFSEPSIVALDYWMDGAAAGAC